jgi:LmbE family N-acetylglucosaminyl deacetylase
MQLDETSIVPYAASPLPVADGPWLVCAPHADDETFGMGGTIALAARAGISVDVVVLTDGALGGTASDLIARRESELRAAAQLLGIRHVELLGQPDRGLAPTPALVEKLSNVIRVRGTRVVFFPGVCEFHPDHRAAALLAWSAIQQCGPAVVPVAYEIAVQSPVNVLVDITPALAAKRRAIACYSSQLAERDYAGIVDALNRLRSLTLGSGVEAAEGFYRFSEAELKHSLREWARDRAGKLLE